MDAARFQGLVDSGAISLDERDERHLTLIAGPDAAGPGESVARYILEEHLASASLNLRSGKSAARFLWYAYEGSPDGRRGDTIGVYSTKDDALCGVADHCLPTLMMLGLADA